MQVPTWVIVLLKIAFSFTASVGVNLQKLSMGREEIRYKSSGIAERLPYFQPLWIFGFALTTLDAVDDFFIMGLAPQSLLVPLGALSLGFNFVLAPFFHKEVVTLGIVLATAIVYCGTVVTLVFGPKDESDCDLAQIRTFASAPEFLWYQAFCALFFCSFSLHGARRREGYGVLHYCALAGCLGGQTMLLMKCSSEIVLNTLAKWDFGDWTSSPVPYLLPCAMIGSLCVELHLLNKGLHKFEALRVVPMYQSFIIFFGITGGLTFFQEYRTMSPLDKSMYSVGSAILLVGVMLLVRQRAKLSSVDDDDDGEQKWQNVKLQESIDEDTEHDSSVDEEDGNAPIGIAGGEQKWRSFEMRDRLDETFENEDSIDKERESASMIGTTVEQQRWQKAEIQGGLDKGNENEDELVL
eukprot:CAMPEP_0172539342 /NCGR_PEP_ID=MMETSP1067-20121228/10554_1 /TAXON_ID=265564 ORGANISM="Thalassiosira punctigera, Strain Tpunct2005C2" /NCGR_SAMPLE_ID=MMETSP1067 /ASSEMBLY_ACC=CAM_ASM_000444 /LENGTH=409 /DNA_ID=CAMNT_0013325013 /DNA_START=211 /DNA_END=1436 /DNA_ORIENTATION=-